MKKKNQKPVSPKSTPPVSSSKTNSVKINAMDLFRAQDAASKAAVSKMTLDGFDNFISRLGLNNDNTLSGGTYDFNLVTRNRLLLEASYRGSWIVGAVVDSVAEDMTRSGIEINTDDSADLSEFEKSMTRLSIWQSLSSLIKWGRLYGGAIAVLQIDGQNMSTPLDLDTIAQGQFKGLAIFDRWMVNPLLSPVIQNGPQIGLPVFYQLVNNPQAYDPTTPTPTGQITVHYTRCIRYTGIDLPFFQAITELMWGESILERLWDRLISFDNATLSSAQLIDRANLRTIGIDGLREIIAAGGEALAGLQAQFEMMRLMQVNEGLTLLDKNDDYQSTAYSFAGLSDMMLQFGQQLSGASGIPLIRLFGQSPAGLAATGESDIRMYYDNINAQQEAKLRGPFEMLLKVMWRSTFGNPAPEDLEFTFTPLWQMTAMDKVANAKTTAETVSGVFEAGLISQQTAMKELKETSGDTGLFNNITDEDINSAEEDAAPMPDEAPAENGSDSPKEGEDIKGKEEAKPDKANDSKPRGAIARWLSRV